MFASCMLPRVNVVLLNRICFRKVASGSAWFGPPLTRISPQHRLQGGPKKRTPSFIFGITSVIQHQF